MTMPGGGATEDEGARSTGGTFGERTQHEAERVRHEAEQRAEEAQGEFRHQTERAQASAEGLKDEAKETALRLVEEAKARVRSAVDERKQGLAEEVAAVADALRAAAHELDQRDHLLARYVGEAAAGLERAAEQVRQQDFAALLQETEAFARRHPGLFFGGVFALGFALTRFVKSSAERQAEQQRGRAAGETAATDMPSGGSTYPPRPAGEASTAASSGAAGRDSSAAGIG